MAVADSGTSKGANAAEDLKKATVQSLEKYVELARRLRLSAAYRYSLGTDVVDTTVQLCQEVAGEFSKSTYFTGQLVFQRVRFFQKLLHNETAFAIQRRLQWNGLTTVILPIRVKL